MMARSSLFRILKKSVRLQVEAKKRGTSPESLLEQIAEARFTRRQFLGTSVAAAGLLSMPPFLRGAWAENNAAPDPVVILGAGYAGLTAAYRCAKAGVPFVVYEAASRFGGRVHSEYNFNKEGMFCELGGELIDTGHSATIALAGELGLALDDFSTTDLALDKAAYEYQGVFYSEKDLIREVKPLAAAVVRDLKEIYGDAEKAAVGFQQPFKARRFDLMSLDQYLESVTDLAKWAREMVRLAYVGEYGLEAGKQSALNLILLIGTDVDGKFDLFGESDEMKRIRGGNSRLSEALAAAAGIEAGKDSARIKYRHTLTAWKKKGANQLLTFATGGGRSVEVKAGQVICTIPFSRLREVHGIGALGFSPQKLKAIRALPYGTNSKLMLSFSSRPWRAVSGPKAPVAATNGSLYSDRFQSVWETSRLQEGKSGIITNYTGGEMGRRLSKADADLVAGAMDRFYPGARAAFDKKSSLMNWAKSPFVKGSFSCPAPGNYTDFFGALHTPELGGHALFAGEHCSVDYQAFMNGAVETAEAAAAVVLSKRGKQK
jgi:monoamine oxidase